MRTILFNGKIYVEKNNFQEAILIEEGIIKQVDSNKIILQNTWDEKIDLEGKVVIPGLNDSHLHLCSIGENMNSCSLAQAFSIDNAIEIGRNFLQENNNLKGLLGKRWNQDLFTEGEKRIFTRHDLDKISTEIPIVYNRVCGHLAVGNTKALALANINENTHVEGGEILIGQDGKPNGILTEGAINLIMNTLPEKSNAEIEAEILKGADYALSMGITSVQSCDMDSKDFETMFKIIHNIYDNQKTKLRYSPQFNFQDINSFKKYIETEHKNEKYDEKFLSKGALKLFKDGSLGARTALMLECYNDEPGTKGVSALSDEKLQSLCDLSAENNIRVVTHAIGDAAIESVINAYEKTMGGKKNPLRHGIVHCQITSKEQIERIATLNIPVMYQPIFLDYDLQVVVQRVGGKLSSTSYAFNTLNKIGSISFGTDSPVEDCNPFPNIYSAVTRQRLNGKPEGGFAPNEKMSVEDSIDAYTIGSAFNEFKENIKGRLKPGYVADLAVLDMDIFTVDHNKIKDIRVEKTMINGEFVFER